MSMPSRFLLMGCTPVADGLPYERAAASDGAVRWPLAHDGSYVQYTRVPPAAATQEPDAAGA